jgi:hypothetical protein
MGHHQAAAIAADSRGWVHVVWSQKDAHAFHLYQSVYLAERWSRATRITAEGTSNIAPALATDENGKIALVWQSLRDGRSVVMLRTWEGKGWGPEQQVSIPGGSAWAPAVAWARGTLWVAWDVYQTGSYRIHVRPVTSSVPGFVEVLGESERFAVNPSLAVSSEGRPVVAWEETDSIWGKDVPFGSDRNAAAVPPNWRIRAAFKAKDGWRELPSPAQSVPQERRLSLRMPRVALDARGNLLLAFRALAEPSLGRSDFRAAVERWESYVTQWEGTTWSSGATLPKSLGRYWLATAIATATDGLRIVWTSEESDPEKARSTDADVYLGPVQLSPKAVPLW